MTTAAFPIHHGSHRRIALVPALTAFLGVAAFNVLPARTASAPAPPAPGPQATIALVAGVR
jgi:hypothetical protein